MLVPNMENNKIKKNKIFLYYILSAKIPIVKFPNEEAIKFNPPIYVKYLSLLTFDSPYVLIFNDKNNAYIDVNRCAKYIKRNGFDFIAYILSGHTY